MRPGSGQSVCNELGERTSAETTPNDTTSLIDGIDGDTRAHAHAHMRIETVRSFIVRARVELVKISKSSIQRRWRVSNSGKSLNVLIFFFVLFVTVRIL